MGHVTWPRPFQGRFVIRRPELAMFNPHIKFEMSTATCNEEIKGNAKCKNSRFEPPRVCTDIKMLFPELSRTSKDQIPGFSRTLKSFFQNFHFPFTNTRSKSANTKSVISVSALQQRSGNAIPEIVLLYLTV